MSRLAWLPVTLLPLLLLCARTAFAHGPYHEEIARYDAEIGRHPDDARLYLGRGQIHRAHGDTEAALADYARAAARDARIGGVDLLRGVALLEGKRPAAAMTYLDLFLATHPDHPRGLMARARAEAALGRMREAADDFSRGLMKLEKPTPDEFVEASSLALNGKRADGALAALDAGIAALGPIVTLLLPAIEIEMSARRWNRALARVDQIMAQSPRKEAWLLLRGEILVQAGRRAEARRAFSAALTAIAVLPPHVRATAAARQRKDQATRALHLVPNRRSPASPRPGMI